MLSLDSLKVPTNNTYTLGVKKKQEGEFKYDILDSMQDVIQADQPRILFGADVGKWERALEKDFAIIH